MCWVLEYTCRHFFSVSVSQKKRTNLWEVAYHVETKLKGGSLSCEYASAEHKLVTFTWGAMSAELTGRAASWPLNPAEWSMISSLPEDMVLVDIRTGEKAEGKMESLLRHGHAL